MIEGLETSPLQTDDFDPHLLDEVRALSKEIIEEPTKRGYRIKVVLP
jgi:hypothetical protein